MTPDAAYLIRPDLAPARYLQRAGQWDTALSLITTDDATAAALRADILVERHMWQLDNPDDAHAAVKNVADPALATLLSAQLEYWRRLFKLDGAPSADPVAGFAKVTTDPQLGAWATFHHAISSENLNGDTEAAAAGYLRALELAPNDLFLESYVVRHQGDQLICLHGNREAGIALARRSFSIRAALGARPQAAAAAAMLAKELPPGAEADEFKELSIHTGRDLGIPWLSE